MAWSAANNGAFAGWASISDVAINIVMEAPEHIKDATSSLQGCVQAATL
jgi:hypothetical protein